MVLKPNAPFDSLKVTASRGVSSSVDSVIVARRMGAPVASCRMTPLTVAKGEGGGPCAKHTGTTNIQPIRMCRILDRCAAPEVPH
jgi:hypothetical protein